MREPAATPLAPGSRTAREDPQVEGPVRAFPLARKVRLLVSPVGVVVREPPEDRRNKAGCYGLLAVMALVAGLLATFGLAAPEKDELNIAITADH